MHAVRRTAEDGELGAVRAGTGLPQRVTVESPPRRGAGDYAVSVAFRLAGPAGMTPYDVAGALRDRLVREAGIRNVEITGGGFLNVTLDERARADLVAELSRPQRRPSHPASKNPPGRSPNDDDQEPPVSFGTQVTDAPAADIARWSGATGEAPAALAVRTAEASTLFRVQYAHARARALVRNARDLGFGSEPYAAADAGSPYGPSGAALLALLADQRRVSEQGDAGRHARHLVAVGDAFFDFHDRCPPLPSGDEKPGAAHRARLALVEATGTVLAGGLTQLGVSTPAHL
nr:DALR anticodon-binding domain-containing protein [Streptomyces sp. HNM0575]